MTLRNKYGMKYENSLDRIELYSDAVVNKSIIFLWLSEFILLTKYYLNNLVKHLH